MSQHQHYTEIGPVELPEDSWLVAVAPGDTRVLSLDELDDAYQAGWVTERTLVWTHEMDEWLPLAEAAGGDDEDELDAEDEQTISRAPSGYPPARAASVAPASAPFSSAPIASAPVSMAPVSAAPLSTAPVAFDLSELDDEEPDFAPKKKAPKWGLFAAAAAVLVAGGFTLENLAGSETEEAAPVVAAAASPRPAITVITPPKVDPDAPLETGGYEVSAAEDRAFKKEAEKERAMREKMQAALAGQEPPPEPKRSGKAWRKPQKAKSGFKGAKGRSAGYDPLNGDLP